VNGESDPNFYLCKNASSETTLDAADASLVAMKSWNGKNNLYKINNKTLIIWGDLDKSYDKNQIDILHSNIKNSELKIINGFAHNVHLENPKIFNKLLLDFLI
jgi:pimeloyl-ACP methyl ester carboxylesterase